MVRDKYAVRLAQEQREELQRLVRVGKNSARVTARARIIIKSADGWAAPQVAEALDVALSTVYRVKQRFAEEGLEKVLQDCPQANRPRKLDDRGEAHLIALACSPAPEVGRPGRGPPDCLGLQPSPGRTCPLDPASVGRQGGRVGAGVLHVP